jgi:hypothetical protein
VPKGIRHTRNQPRRQPNSSSILITLVLEEGDLILHAESFNVWNAISGQGNPTRSIEVNTLIKKVREKAVRKQGVVSKARHAVTHVEFRRMQSILREKNDLIRRYGIPSILKQMMVTWAELLHCGSSQYSESQPVITLFAMG